MLRSLVSAFLGLFAILAVIRPAAVVHAGFRRLVEHFGFLVRLLLATDPGSEGNGDEGKRGGLLHGKNQNGKPLCSLPATGLQPIVARRKSLSCSGGFHLSDGGLQFLRADSEFFTEQRGIFGGPDLGRLTGEPPERAGQVGKGTNNGS